MNGGHTGGGGQSRKELWLQVPPTEFEKTNAKLNSFEITEFRMKQADLCCRDRR